MQIIINKTWFPALIFLLGLVGILMDNFIIFGQENKTCALDFLPLIVGLLLVNVCLYLSKPINHLIKNKLQLKQCNSLLAFFVFIFLLQLFSILFFYMLGITSFQVNYNSISLFYLFMLMFAGVLGYIKMKLK